MRNEALLSSLDRKIAEHHLLKHPFYQEWSKGTLSRETLALYATQYYHHVLAFPVYLRCLAAHAEPRLRVLTEMNLAEEMDPRGPHPALWRRFAKALGVTAEILDTAEPLPAIRSLVGTYRHLAETASPEEAVAALYAYEAQVPEISTEKRRGLEEFYGLTDAKSVAYFSVHEEADVRHRAAWRDWLGTRPDKCNGKMVTAAERGLLALWGALDAVHAYRPAVN
jgi:pyrroloquinoline-quinone synthase